jgi:hypothetical protein
MSGKHWLTKSTRTRKHTVSRFFSRQRRLMLEGLEDRLALAAAYVLSGSNLLSFDTATPAQVSTIALTGVNAGETLVGIDFRPQNGNLYALGVTTAGAGTLYNVSVRTGVATAVGTAGSVTPTAPMPNPTLATSGFGFDFNPLVDRIRVISSAGQSFVIDPNTGFVVANAPTLNGGTTTADGTAYTNNQPNATATTHYTIDSASDTLYLQNPATSLTTAIGTGIGFDFNRLNGFDIPTGVNAAATNAPVVSGSAFAVLTVGGTAGLYNINLVTGAAAFVGNVGTGTTPVQGLAIQNDLGGIPAIALDASGPNLVRFNTSTPGTTTTVAVTGITSGETLVGIDFRPQTGQLFGLGVNAAGNTGTLYRLDPQTGTATATGTVGQIAFVDGSANPVDLPDPAAAGYGFDFNPTVDRIRVTTSTGLNFRVNPNNGAPVDGDLNTGAGSVPGTNTDAVVNGSGSTGVSGAAYTNSFGQTLGVNGPTTQYTLNAASNTLFIQNPPNAGTQTTPVAVTLGGATLDFSDVNGFDIPGNVRVTTSAAQSARSGFAALTVGGVSGIYRIDLTSGAATSLGAVGTGLTPLAGFTLADVADAVVVTVDPEGNLNVDGSSEDDIVTITGIPPGVAGSGMYLVTTQRGSQAPQTQTVTGVIGDILVNLHGGNDQLTMNNAYVNGSIRIDMESGNDTVTLGNADVVSTRGDLDVDLGTGNDVLNGRRIFIAGDQDLLGGDGNDAFTFDGVASPFTLGTSAAGNANWSTGNGDDTVHVIYAFIVGAFAIDLGVGTDSLDIFGSAASGDVSFFGGTGVDSLTVDTNFFDSQLLLDGGADNDTIFLANGLGTDIGTINTGAGDDTVTVQNETQVSATIDTGSGDDTVDVRSSAVDRFFALLGDDDDELTLFGNLLRIEADLDGGAGSADRLIDLGNDVRGTLRTRNFELFG